MGKVVDRKTDEGEKRPTKARPGHSNKLSPAGAKIVSAFQEAIDTCDRASRCRNG